MKSNGATSILDLIAPYLALQGVICHGKICIGTWYVVGASNNVVARRTLISPDKIKNNSSDRDADPFHEA